MKFRVYLRALEPDDYLISIKWRQDEEIQNMVGGLKYFVSSEKEKQWVQDAIFSDDRVVLAVCLKENDKYIGNITLHEIDSHNRSARIPIMIGDKTEWGKGYAAEASMIMHKFAFDERGMERIYAHILENNTASLNMYKTCGYKKEGLMRRSVYKNGVFYNQFILSVLREEFEQAYKDYCERFK